MCFKTLGRLALLYNYRGFFRGNDFGVSILINTLTRKNLFPIHNKNGEDFSFNHIVKIEMILLWNQSGTIYRSRKKEVIIQLSCVFLKFVFNLQVYLYFTSL